MLGSIFRNIDYRADAALVLRYTGVQLSRETFDQYADTRTLSGSLGTAAQLEKDHHGYGVPRGVGDAEICARILSSLDNMGIHFDNGPGTPLGQKLSQYLGACCSANQWLNLPDHYFKQGLPDNKRMTETWFWLAGVSPP